MEGYTVTAEESLPTEHGIPEEIDFWGAPDEDRLYCNDLDEAIENTLDRYSVAEFPETIEMVGWARNTIAHMDGDWILNDIIEKLDEDEDVGDPEGGSSGLESPSQELRELADEFAEALIAEYRVWCCHVVETRTINVAEWVKLHRPDWLKPPASQVAPTLAKLREIGAE